MQRILLSVALVALSSTAFAQGASPARHGRACAVVTDHRGFSYWRGCEYHSEVLQAAPMPSTRSVPRRQPAITHVAPVDFSGASGGGGDAGGGGAAGGGGGK